MYITSLGRISREGYTHTSIPLSRDVRQPSFYRHRLSLYRATVGFHSFYYSFP